MQMRMWTESTGYVYLYKCVYIGVGAASFLHSTDTSLFKCLAALEKYIFALKKIQISGTTCYISIN